MNDDNDLDLADEEILACDSPDEALEAAAMETRASFVPTCEIHKPGC